MLLRTLQSENEDGNVDVGTWKSVITLRMRKTKENPFGKIRCTERTWKGKLWRYHENL